jgi:hypothetical protein
MTSKKTSTVQCRQCARAGAHWYDFTRCNHQSRDRALQYHNPARNAAATAVSACPSPALARAVSCWPIAHLGPIFGPHRTDASGAIVRSVWRLILLKVWQPMRPVPSWALQSPQITAAGVGAVRRGNEGVASRRDPARTLVPLGCPVQSVSPGTWARRNSRNCGRRIVGNGDHSSFVNRPWHFHEPFAIRYLLSSSTHSGRRCSV